MDICLECGEQIREEQRPAIRLWDSEDRQYSFHRDCFERATEGERRIEHE